jgi:hypothetical protein
MVTSLERETPGAGGEVVEVVAFGVGQVQLALCGGGPAAREGVGAMGPGRLDDEVSFPGPGRGSAD